jgi:cytochrome oxidase Cu insertion factor (SCO1/SenC/PrrC family)
MPEADSKKHRIRNLAVLVATVLVALGLFLWLANPLVQTPAILNANEQQSMTPLEKIIPAPDFALDTADGQAVSLSDYQGQKSVVLVFNRGFS